MPATSDSTPSYVPAKVAWRAFWRDLSVRCGRALAEWLAHSLLLFGVFVCIAALLRGLAFLGIGKDKMFFDRIPLRWLIDGADLALLVAFALIGVVAAVRCYIGYEKL
ncbi:MAG: hypothetical protein AABO58_11300 [Acidobacteriota bacterium]